MDGRCYTHYAQVIFNVGCSPYYIHEWIVGNTLTHPARAKVMLKKTLHKNSDKGVYHEPMVVSKQALPKLCLFLPIVKRFQITFSGKLSLISS